ncbi:MAG: hypothetical protein AAB373_04585 [Patescibacteria group bacterium]
MENQPNVPDVGSNLKHKAEVEKQIDEIEANPDKFDPNDDTEMSPAMAVQKLKETSSELNKTIRAQIESGKNPEALQMLVENKVPGVTVPQHERELAIANPNIGAEYITRFLNRPSKEWDNDGFSGYNLLLSVISNPSLPANELLEIADYSLENKDATILMAILRIPNLPRQIIDKLYNSHKQWPQLRQIIEHHPNF